MKSTMLRAARGKKPLLAKSLAAPALLAALLAALCTTLLSGCATRPAPPAWQGDASEAVDAFSDAYLSGNTAAAQASFARAQRATGSTGKLELAAQLELVRCALQAASLEFDDCPGFTKRAPHVSAPQQAYAAYLAGRWENLAVAALPVQHQGVVASGSLAGVNDPLARLVAAGALLRAGRSTPQVIQAALETASEQGWRRPLLAWLGVARQRALALGDGAAVVRIERRIALVGGRD